MFSYKQGHSHKKYWLVYYRTCNPPLPLGLLLTPYQTVYKTEECCNGKEVIYHKLCLRCKFCKVSLIGRSPVNEEDKTGALSKAQYCIVKEDSQFEYPAGTFLCEKHA